jgi:Ca2+-binding RTX toxin-like protein
MVLADGVPTFEAADHGVWIDLAAHAIRDDGFGGSGTIVNVENVFGSALDDTLVGDAGDNLLSGLDGADYIRGGAGNDTLIGGAGDDYLRGGSGVDSYDGGDGFDRVSFYEADATQGVVVDLRTQTVLNDGFGNVEHMSSIEALGAGTRFADTFYGDDNANLIYVDRGDTAYGFGGDDTFEVGAQAPALLDGGDGVDTLAYFALDTGATHGVTVDLAAQAILDDGLGQSGVVRGFENLGGSDLNDVLRGDAGANRIQGFDGDDILTGGEGADTFVYGRAHYGDGHDQITDFQSGVDHIEFGGLHGVHGFTDLTLGHDAAGDVTISWGTAGETITLLGVHDVTAADFLFG